ncbi:MAG: prephenate dehydratase [Kiritimatiellaeota bacterium]|nr:prephenate dehydratase [Kiritimatiellota bacterium]
MKIDGLRKKVDALDRRIVELLNDRTKLALRIGGLKKKSGAEIYAPAREKAVFQRIRSLNGGPLPYAALRAIYREIMSASLALEHPVVVAYLGPQATFTHEAACSRFGASVEYLPCETITDVFAAVQKRSALYGVVPIENSIEGAVTHTLDRFIDTALRICAEIYLPIALHLMAPAGRRPIRRLYSKSEVFGQCRRWLHANLPGVDLIPVSSTARAAEMAARERGAAALAGVLAAELNGLRLLARDVQDSGGNTTRFLVIGQQYGPPTGHDKTSVFFAVKHKVGALYGALESFKKARINMTKIESRPSRTKAWEYYFFVDVDGHAADARVQQALGAMAEHCTLLTVLGAYPRAVGSEG